MYDLSCMLIELTPFAVLDRLPGLYGLKYDSATACGLPLYLCSYELVGSTTLKTRICRSGSKGLRSDCICICGLTSELFGMLYIGTICVTLPLKDPKEDVWIALSWGPHVGLKQPRLVRWLTLVSVR